ncbi:aromatic acid exporter family protein [Clostridium cochlearium]|uniref:FUSC family protein n=1 Tax=Clostridium cochlearium TaxID=1494 RepID=UPI00181A94AC|nr:aromatic acid exporter family protein [Clostridium cochlearium]NMA58212.1 hypothetical protein [Clostridium cochlearium]
MKIKKVGLRNLKTALAVALTIFLSQILNLRSPFFAGIAAITAMQSSVSESFNSGVDRMFSTILGGIIALLFSLVAPENPFFIALGIIIIIYLCNVFDWKQSVQLSGMVFLSIILNYEEGSRVDYAFYRTVDTLFGLVIGTLINYFVLPPNLEDKMLESVKKMYSQVKNIVGTIIWKEEGVNLETLRKDLIEIEENYNILKKEAKLNLYKSHTLDNLEIIFELLENIYSNLSIIYSMDKTKYIDEENRKSLESLFGRKLPKYSEKDECELDLIYNYHLKNIIDNLSNINILLKE